MIYNQKNKSVHRGRENKPWFTNDCKFARQNYRKLKRKLKKRPSTLLKNQVKESEKKYKKTLDKALKTYKKNMMQKMKKLRSNNTKEYWQILNKRVHANQPDIKFDKLLEFFKDLNSKDNMNFTDRVNLPNLDYDQINNLNEEINCEISKEEILNCIKKLKNNKACGDDFIIYEYIKCTSDQFIDIYVKLFNLIFQTGIVPKSWVL